MPRVSSYPTATALDADDEFYVVEDGNSRKTTLGQFALGWGQTWQDVSGSRTVGTSYQNTTAKPIMVNLQPTSATVGEFQVSTDGTTWLRLAILVASGSDIRQGAWIVPPGYYYRVTAGTVLWAELR